MQTCGTAWSGPPLARAGAALMLHQLNRQAVVHYSFGLDNFLKLTFVFEAGAAPATKPGPCDGVEYGVSQF
jgi:hypothetical protein